MKITWRRYVRLSTNALITFCVVGFAAHSVRSQTLGYSIELVEKLNSTILRVSLEFKGNSSGQSKLVLPSEWSSGTNLFRNIKDLETISSEVKILQTDTPHIKILTYPPNKKVSVKYDVVDDLADKKMSLEDYSRPVLKPTYVYCTGQALWVYPETSNDSKISFELTWKNIPENWLLINSFGERKTKQKFSTSLESFRSGTFLAGDYRIKRFLVRKQPVYAVLRGKFLFSDEEYYEAVNRIANIERDFWRSDDFTPLLIALLPVEGSEGVFGGEGRTNGCSLFLLSESTGFSTANMRLLAHELFHVWNPGRLGGLDTERLYWFSEGFTNYYANLLLLRSGLITLEQFISEYNSAVEAYYISPVRDIPIDEAVQKRHLGGDAEKIFYYRGCVFAYYWDFTIWNRSRNSNSLDSIMRSLIRRFSLDGLKLTEARIAEASLPYLGKKAAEDIEKFIGNGELIPVMNIFGNFADQVDLEYRWFETGFDFQNSFKSRLISGVITGSNAHDAGLRNGQKWLTGGMVLGDPKRLTKLTVLDGTVQKVVQFYPASKKSMTIPQFKLRESLNSNEKSRLLRNLGVLSLNQPNL